VSFALPKVSLENLDERIADLKTFKFSKTGFSFLDDHYGLRPGSTHVILGTAGKGKSTLTRSIAKRLIENHKVLLVGTEESKPEVEVQLCLMDFNAYHTEKNLFYIHEREDLEITPSTTMNVADWLAKIEGLMDSSGCEIFIYDNITCSFLYEQIGNQQPMIFGLKDILKRKGIPAIIVAHTRKGVQASQFFTEDDVRGSAQLALATEFLYAFNFFIQPTGGDEAKTAAIRVMKSRAYRNGGRAYELKFDGNSYSTDRRIKLHDLEKMASKNSKAML
jgi:KaiC/GvpD/RAD55 family RecA-like ATPase